MLSNKVRVDSIHMFGEGKDLLFVAFRREKLGLPFLLERKIPGTKENRFGWAHYVNSQVDHGNGYAKVTGDGWTWIRG